MSARWLIMGVWATCPRYLKGEPDGNASPDWVHIDDKPTEYSDKAKAEKIAAHPRVKGVVVPS